jgi:F0F1-type ATP synthase delta subunit
MKVSRLKIARVISNETLKQFDSKKLAKEIAAYLLSEDRIDELDSVIRDVVAYRAEAGLVEANVSSAHDLDALLKKEVSQLVRTIKPQAKQVVINVEKSPSLIGGIKMNLANEQLDLSIRAKLNQFKQATLTKGRV